MTNAKLFVTAYLWNMLGKLFIRSLGIVSSLIIVRLLSPEDFGIIAISMMVVGFFAVLSNCGANRYLILHDDPTDEDYNSVWTLNILLRVVALSAVLLLVPFIVETFDQPEIMYAVFLMAGIEAMAAFNNIGVVQQEKAIHLGPINKVMIVAKISSAIATIYFAWTLKNFYALIIGSAINVFITIIGTYIASLYRPKFRFKFKKELFVFSSTLLVRNIISYSRSQVDILLVGKFFGTGSAGGYSIARQFAIMPQTEIIAPAMQPLFALMSKLKHKQAEFERKLYQTCYYAYLFIFPAAVGLFLVAEPFVLTVLGEKWAFTISYFGLLGFLMIIFFTQQALYMVYDAKRKIVYSMVPDLLGIALIVGGVLIFAPGNETNFAELRIAVAGLAYFILLVCARIFVNVSITKVLRSAIIPAAGSLVMFFSLSHTYIFFEIKIIELFYNSFTGGVIYFISTILFIGILFKINPKHDLITFLPAKIYNYLQKWLATK